MRRAGGAANGSEGAGASESWRLPRAWPGGARAACDRMGRVALLPPPSLRSDGEPSWGRVRLPHQQKRAEDLRWSSSAHSECLTCGRARYTWATQLKALRVTADLLPDLWRRPLRPGAAVTKIPTNRGRQGLSSLPLYDSTRLWSDRCGPGLARLPRGLAQRDVMAILLRTESRAAARTVASHSARYSSCDLSRAPSLKFAE